MKRDKDLKSNSSFNKEIDIIPNKKSFLRKEADKQIQSIYLAIEKTFTQLEHEIEQGKNKPNPNEKDVLNYRKYKKISDIKNVNVLHFFFSTSFGTQIFNIDKVHPEIYTLVRKFIIESELNYSNEQVLELILFVVSDFINFTTNDLRDKPLNELKAFKVMYKNFILRNYNQNYNGVLSVNDYFIEFIKNANRSGYEYYASKEEWEDFFNNAILDINVPIESVIISQLKDVVKYDDSHNFPLKESLIPIILDNLNYSRLAHA